ncbi:MAG: LysR family transcriptional regulator [Pseudomonadota bacterium]|nr:LysR family transcriptional regulator [Pseudomonadota bacterium]
MSILKDNLKQLYYFYESVKNNNISTAAKKLFISQPAISMQIKKLENCCGIKLIREKNCKKIQPTPEGRKLYEYLDRVFKLLDKAEAELKKMAADEQTHITIGTTPTYGKFILPYIFENYAGLFPQCHIKVTSGSSISLLESLKQHKLDVIIMALWKKLSLKNFLVYPLGQEEVILLSAPDYHLQKQTYTSLKDLQSEKFIMRDEQSATRKYILREFKKRGVTLPISIECESPDLVKELILEGKGIGFLTRTKIRKELSEGLVKRVNLGKHKFHLDIAIVLNKNKNLMPEMLTFVDCIIKKSKQVQHFSLPPSPAEMIHLQESESPKCGPLK